MNNKINLMHGDCLQELKKLKDNSIDSIVTDPPYGLSFMGKKWDYDVPSVEIWKECLRVLKPGGHLLAFAGTRTQHRMCVRIEDAGFEIRDMMAWVYGSGFPKSHDVSKAIDKAAGAERDEVGYKSKNYGVSVTSGKTVGGNSGGFNHKSNFILTAPSTPEAKQWEGWGTALKPALEPITLARKPFVGTVADNVTEHGTGGINIDGCRVGSEGGGTNCNNRDENGKCMGHNNAGRSTSGQTFHTDATTHDHGRFPANLIHDGSEEIQEVFGESSRFFYCAKASKKDREEGLDGMEEKKGSLLNTCGGIKLTGSGNERSELRKNNHPTVKPTDLMRYLCRLVTPPGGTVLDPFMGSGSTGKAANLEGFGFVGIERELDFFNIAKKRVGKQNGEKNDG